MYSFKLAAAEHPRQQAHADDVPEVVKTRRIVEQNLQREIQHRWHDRAVGAVADVLVDGMSRRRVTELSGRTSGKHCRRTFRGRRRGWAYPACAITKPRRTACAVAP